MTGARIAGHRPGWNDRQNNRPPPVQLFFLTQQRNRIRKVGHPWQVETAVQPDGRVAHYLGSLRPNLAFAKVGCTKVSIFLTWIAYNAISCNSTPAKPCRVDSERLPMLRKHVERVYFYWNNRSRRAPDRFAPHSGPSLMWLDAVSGCMNPARPSSGSSCNTRPRRPPEREKPRQTVITGGGNKYFPLHSSQFGGRSEVTAVELVIKNRIEMFRVSKICQ